MTLEPLHPRQQLIGIFISIHFLRESTLHTLPPSGLHHRIPPAPKFVCYIYIWLRNHEHNSRNHVMAESPNQLKLLTWSTCDGTLCGLPYVVLACAFSRSAWLGLTLTAI